MIKKGQIEFPEEFSGPKSNQNDTRIANPLLRRDKPAAPLHLIRVDEQNQKKSKSLSPLLLSTIAAAVCRAQKYQTSGPAD
jgi:hypothetical protein